MNQQPDKFFRDKLDRYQKPAPAGAWNKLEAGLAKKNKKPVTWLAIAASLLLLAAAAFLFWSQKKNTSQPAPLVTKQENVPSYTAPEKNIQPENNPAVVAPKTLDEQKSPVPHKPTPEKTERIKQKAPAADVTVAGAGAEERVVTTPEEPSETKKSLPEQRVVTNATPSTAQSEDKNIKLVFSAAESEAYLNKKSLAEATSSGKKSSTLKKLLKKAEDLKTNQDPFGELRQKKNEILALNFRTDKQRGQNK
jgi:hypothetical protein